MARERNIWIEKFNPNFKTTSQNINLKSILKQKKNWIYPMWENCLTRLANINTETRLSEKDKPKWTKELCRFNVMKREWEWNENVLEHFLSYRSLNQIFLQRKIQRCFFGGRKANHRWKGWTIIMMIIIIQHPASSIQHYRCRVALVCVCVHKCSSLFFGSKLKEVVFFVKEILKVRLWNNFFFDYWPRFLSLSLSHFLIKIFWTFFFLVNRIITL